MNDKIFKQDEKDLKAGSIACQFMWPTIRDQLENSKEPILFWQGFYAQLLAYTQVTIGENAIPAIASVTKATHQDNESEKPNAGSNH